MNNDIKEILDRLKDSANNPIIDVPVMGGVSEPIDNSQCLEPNECIKLLDYITNLQRIEKEHQKLNGELREEINFLKLNNPDANIEHFRVVGENKRKINNLRAENKKLKQDIIILEKYLELIHDLGYDYDGLNYEHDLKNLIDEMVRFASLGRAYNTTNKIYVDGKGKSFNILGEELKGEDNE